ncbi:MAG: hypothetical protein Pars2KO_21340 [Parasphingorhabdus sp.]
MPLIEMTVGSQWSSAIDWHKFGSDSATAALAVTPYASLLADSLSTEISIKLSDNEEVQKLNDSYRRKNRPTNVLSFPLVDKNHLGLLSKREKAEILLGDIILAKSVCQTEADEKQIPLERHVSHLIVHGTLHLLGYDHQDEAEALLMERLEVKALETIGIANPYLEDSVKKDKINAR